MISDLSLFRLSNFILNIIVILTAFRSIIFIFFSFFQIYAADDAVEIVKAVSPDQNGSNEPEKEPDQVALESQDQDSSPAILLPHGSPPGLCHSFFDRQLCSFI